MNAPCQQQSHCRTEQLSWTMKLAALRSPDYEAGCWVQLRTMKLGALHSPPKSQPCPAAGVLLPKLTHVSSASVCWYPTPPSPDSPAPTPTRSIWVPAVHPRIRHSTNLGQNKVLYRFFSPMVPRALMRGEQKKSLKKQKTRRLQGGTNEAAHQVRWRPSNGTAHLAGEVPAPPIGGQVSASLRAGGVVANISAALPPIPEQPLRGAG